MAFAGFGERTKDFGGWIRSELIASIDDHPYLQSVAIDLANTLFDNLKPGVDLDEVAGRFVLGELGLSPYASDDLRGLILANPDLNKYVGRQLMGRSVSCLRGESPPE